jgi:hypothetical protein
MSKNCFVFVVCGAQEHIDTLHFSLTYLKRFSKHEIFVLTDSSRNEIPIIHDTIIDVQTPSAFNHHQASIYLKTGIFQFVPKGNRYCYLDTDVIAFSDDVDSIFNAYHSPITFAPDHCKMDQFSAYAVNCGCIDLYKSYTDSIENKLFEIDPLRRSQKPSIVSNRKKLVSFYKEKNTIPKKIMIGLKFLLSFKQFSISEGIYFDKKQKTWKDKNGEVFMTHFRWPAISKQSGLKWNYVKGHPLLPDGRSLWQMSCNHLKNQIESTFNVKVGNENFQHWNGGVFLFNDDSHGFLESWHSATMKIFKDPNWKTRDQGTLIATVWKFQLQNHPTLNKKWNLIADYYNQELEWMEDHKIQLHKNEIYEPKLIHVYHHFQDTSWEFWNQLMENLKE